MLRKTGQMKWVFKKDEMKANAGSEKVFVARDFCCERNAKCVKQFASLESHAALAEYIQTLCDTGEEACIYEMIPYNTPCKLYLDIEWVAAAGDSASASILRKIVEYIDLLLRETVADPRHRESEILESTRMAAKGSLRYSYHLIYPYITFSNNTESMKAFVTRVHNHFSKELSIKKNPIDLSVYSRDRLFRAPLCWKATDQHKAQMKWVSGASSLERLENSLVTKHAAGGAIIGKPLTQCTKAPRLRPPVRQAKQSACKDALSFAGLDVNIELCRQRLQKLLTMYGGMGSLKFYKVCENTFSSGSYMLFRFEHSIAGREEPCLAHGICSKVTHKRDNQLLLLDENLVVHIVCPHQGKCRKRRFRMCQLQQCFFSTATSM